MLSEITTHSEKEWRADLQQIKDLGFNAVRTWVEWATCEPEPGKYNFANLHLLMRIANELGLKVFIQIYADSAPDWLRMIIQMHFRNTKLLRVHPQSAPGCLYG
jgi:beta-galactosidase